MSRKAPMARGMLGNESMWGCSEDEPKVSRSLLEGIVAHAPDAIFVVDEQGLIVLANAAAARLFRASEEELVGLCVDELVPEAYRAQHSLHRAAFMQRPKARSMGSDSRVPALRRDGTEVIVEAALNSIRTPGRTYVVAILRDVTARVQEEERLRWLSAHDGLTGLYNRAHFEAEVSRLAAGRIEPVSVVVIDIDDLKMTNDTHGHAAGDQQLRRLAAVLRTAFRADDIVARTGGDEFVVLLPGVEPKERDQAVHRFLEDLDRQNEVAARPLRASIGVATAKRAKALSTAIRAADERMYAAKRKRKTISSSEIVL